MIRQEVATKMTGQTAARDLAEFIARHYPGRVVEVGVGHFPYVAQRLSEMGLEVILTDRVERILAGMRVEKDDIFAPQREIYQGAGLIYSIRPPLEMQLPWGSWRLRWVRMSSSGPCRMRSHSSLDLAGGWSITGRRGFICSEKSYNPL